MFSGWNTFLKPEIKDARLILKWKCFLSFRMYKLSLYILLKYKKILGERTEIK